MNIRAEDYLFYAYHLAFKAKKKYRFIIDIDTLKQIAALGLLLAIKSFNPKRKMTFKSYAKIRVTGYIIDQMRVRSASRNNRKKLFLKKLEKADREIEIQDWWNSFEEVEYKDMVMFMARFLPKRQRQIFLERFLKGKTGKQMAEEMGITESSVNVNFYLAKKKLKRFLTIEQLTGVCYD